MGNKRLSYLVDANLDAYNRANLFEKKHIREGIVETIFQSEGRFLKKRAEDGRWIEIQDQTEIMERVCRGFRNSKARRVGSGSGSGGGGGGGEVGSVRSNEG